MNVRLGLIFSGGRGQMFCEHRERSVDPFSLK